MDIQVKMLPTTITDNPENLVVFHVKSKQMFQKSKLFSSKWWPRDTGSFHLVTWSTPESFAGSSSLSKQMEKGSMEKAHMFLKHLVVALPLTSHWWELVTWFHLNDGALWNPVPVWAAALHQHRSLCSTGHFCHGRAGELSGGLHSGVEGNWGTQHNSLAFGLSKGRRWPLLKRRGRADLHREHGYSKVPFWTHTVQAAWDI